MTEQYIYRSGQKLRCGYTTGSCAAAASGAAAEMLISGCKTNFSEIITPKGIPLKLEILDAEINRDYASCAVKKDSGDDPDITNGILIYAKVSKIPNGIEITGGKGIGKVTKAGLDQPIGEAAINSVPRKMIAAAVNEAAEKHDYHGGFHIEISVPNGEETALKTGEKHFEPGILADANRNILYIDEINLLDDHVVDVILDSAAMGVNTVEREGVSFSHPAKFVVMIQVSYFIFIIVTDL